MLNGTHLNLLTRTNLWGKLEEIDDRYDILLVNPAFYRAISSPSLRITFRIAPSLQSYIEVNHTFSYVMMDLPRELNYRTSDGVIEALLHHFPHKCNSRTNFRSFIYTLPTGSTETFLLTVVEAA